MSKDKNEYLAKSYPIETIQEHTDNLLKELERLKKIYPDLFKSQGMYYLLEKACIFHDLGKMNTKFQKMVRENKRQKQIPHGILSLCFLNKKIILKELSEIYMNTELEKSCLEFKLKVLAHAIAYHHDRTLDYLEEELEEEVKDLQEQANNFIYDKLKEFKVKKISRKVYTKNSRIYPPEKMNTEKDLQELKMFYEYIFIKGLLNRLDYAASAHIPVEVENDFLEEKMKKLLSSWKEKNKESEWNELQEYAIKNRDKNLVVVAQTGMGKTEAGLLWLGNNKGFFILPLKTAINAIYKRVESIVSEGEELSDKIGLLHSETLEKYVEVKDKMEENFDLDRYYDATKQLSLPMTICTLDQIFDFVFRGRGFEPKLATLSYSKIIIDEIQMYSPSLLAYVIRGLADLTKLGGKFIILTATLPGIVVDLLKNEGIEFEKSKNFTKKDLQIRHSVKVIKNLIDTDFIVEKYNKNKVLVICNTIKEAQRVADELREKVEDENEVNVLHSKFIKRDRNKKEQEILELGRRGNNDHGIWVTTQVVEASLDIDFDLLFTELSDLNGLLQRMGRCYRNRKWDKGKNEYNCFVFVGTEEDKNTGIVTNSKNKGGIIDPQIYKLSREVIINNFNGELSEKDKMKYVENLYTTENLSKTNYCNDVKKTLNYLSSLYCFEKSKEEVQKLFRNIASFTVIPKNIYEENLDKINNFKKILAKKYSECVSRDERKKLREDKIKARKDLYQLTVSIQYYEKPKKIEEQVEISQWEKIEVIDCYYDQENGFKGKKEQNEDEKVENFI